jgi:molybdopterin-guanine dinucleotide biosynthesis protein A
MPLLQPELLAELLRLIDGHDAAVPLNVLPEPLCAVYATTCIPAIRRRIQAGEYKVTGFFGAIDVRYVEPDVWQRFDPDGVSFLNVNREDDLHRAEVLLSAVGDTVSGEETRGEETSAENQ